MKKILFGNNTDRRIAMILNEKSETLDENFIVHQYKCWIGYILIVCLFGTLVSMSGYNIPLIVVCVVASLVVSLQFARQHKEGYAYDIELIRWWRGIKYLLWANAQQGRLPSYRSFSYALERTEPGSSEERELIDTSYFLGDLRREYFELLQRHSPTPGRIPALSLIQDL